MRCSRARLHHPALLGFGILVAVLVASSRVEAINPVISKLHGRPPASHAGDLFGSAVAINEAWIVVGAPKDDERGPDAGAIFVYSAVTGQFVRKIHYLGLIGGEGFGSSLALLGNQVLVGAPLEDAAMGRAYLINLSTGKVIREFFNPAGVPGDQFGFSVALSANVAAIGAPEEAGDAGAVYVFNLAFSMGPSRIGAQAPPPAAFGHSVALASSSPGSELLIVGQPTSSSGAGAIYVFHALTSEFIWGLPGVSGGGFGLNLAVSGGKLLASNRRSPAAAQLFDLRTGTLLRTLNLAAFITPSGGPGFPLGLQGNLALVGGSGDSSLGFHAGAAFLFDTQTGALLLQVLAPDGDAEDLFGSSVALAGNLAVVGVPEDDDLGTDAGAVYFVRPVSAPLPLASVAKVGDFAPGTPQCDFNVFKAAHINAEGEVFLNASLRGVGSNSATDTGVWTRLAQPQSFDMALVSRQDLTRFGTVSGQSYVGVKAGAIFSPVLTRNEAGLFQSLLTGAGVTAVNNRAVFRDDGATIAPVLRTDRAIGLGAFYGIDWQGARVRVIQQVAQAPLTNAIVVPCTLRTGVANTTAANDSGILVLDHGGSVANTHYREGNFSPTGSPFGQFMGKAAAAATQYFAYRAFTVPTGQTPKQTIFYGELTEDGGDLGIQGQDPGGVGGAKYAAFSGESLVGGWTYWRATLTGTGVTTLNNQTLWHENIGLILRTGHEIEPALFVSRIEKYWALSNNLAIIQVLLRGTGVTTANNRALYLWFNTGSNVYQRLMRANDPAEGCGTARIAGIQQVETEPSGRYAILASLSGASPSANQALFMGNAAAGDASPGRRNLRQPFMVLRKGRSYQAPTGQSTRILTMALTNTTDTDGVGNKGMGQVINPAGQIVINILFSDSAREIMIGAP